MLYLEIEEVEARDCSKKDLLGHANKTSYGPDLTGLGILRDCPGTDIHQYMNYYSTLGLLDIIIVYYNDLGCQMFQL